MNNVSFFLLFFVSLSFFAQSPPDAPLTPQEWISKMDNGLWWLFKIPPRNDNNILTDHYNEKILDSMQQKLCVSGGRLHFSAGGNNNNMFVPGTHQIYQQAIDSLELIIDDMIDRDMAFCLMVDFQPSDFVMTEDIKQRYYDAWEQICDAYKDKSHLMAMSPVIEFHGWQDLPPADRRDSLNVFYDHLTLIFRQYNPTRIMSYKPWGAARRAEFNTLTFPYGNDPAPDSGQPIYYMASFSGGYGLGEWWRWSESMDVNTLHMIQQQTLNAGGDSSHVWGINAAVEYRNNTGIQFWCDHWSPNFYKHINDSFPERWTIEQNIAYVQFFRNALASVGSCGAGIQLNKFWDDVSNDFIRETANPDDRELMSLALIDLYRSECDALSYDESGNSFDKIKIYPNPATDKIIVKTNTEFSKDIHMYNVMKNDVTSLLEISFTSNNIISIDVRRLSQGFYILSIENKRFKILID